MDKANSFVFLRDQTPLSDEEFDVANQARSFIQRVVTMREAYLHEHDLDPDVHLPQANWSLDSPIYEGYRQVISGDREILDHLRLFSQMFTGYRLCDLKSAHGTYIPIGVPRDLDSSLKPLSRSSDPWVKRYRRAIDSLPAFLKLGPPAKFGEIGWLVNGVIVNADTCVYLERLALMHAGGLLDPADTGSLHHRKPLTILEIGGGYGGLAYYVRRLIPHARYIIVDLPESLIFSSIYLSVLFKDLENHFIEPGSAASALVSSTAGITFVPNYVFPRLRSAGLAVDLAINTLSMSEMSEPQVAMYCGALRHLLGSEGVFFEQNQDNRSIGLLNAMDLLANHFSRCADLDCTALPGITQGKAHLWRN